MGALSKTPNYVNTRKPLQSFSIYEYLVTLVKCIDLWAWSLENKTLIKPQQVVCQRLVVQTESQHTSITLNSIFHGSQTQSLSWKSHDFMFAKYSTALESGQLAWKKYGSISAGEPTLTETLMVLQTASVINAMLQHRKRTFYNKRRLNWLVYALEMFSSNNLCSYMLHSYPNITSLHVVTPVAAIKSVTWVKREAHKHSWNWTT